MELCSCIKLNDKWVVKRPEENDINIAKLCIHKAADSGNNEVMFPSLSWTHLFIIY